MAIMATSRTESTPSPEARSAALAPDRGLFRQPLLSAVALAPWLLLHAFVGSPEPMGVAAYVGLREPVMRLMTTAWWAPACVVLLVLAAAHSASRAPWKVRPLTVLWMYLEGLGWSLPLLAPKLIPAHLATPLSLPGWAPVAAGRAGAGLYEEFAFRAVLITVLVLVGTLVLHLKRDRVGFAAIFISGVLFAMGHVGSGVLTAWASWSFLFRVVAGVYLASVFWYRGYGVAAGAHIAYNLMADAW